VAGVLTGSKALIEQIFTNEFMNIGPSLSPHSAWLLIRGLRTLPLRLQRSFETTKTVVNWLKKQPQIDHILWPFDSDFKQAELARRQMQGCGGLFSFAFKDSSLEKIETFCNNLKHILMAVSWGGHESLIVPVIAGIKAADYEQDNSRHQLIRLYMGLEEPDYIIKDIAQALPV
jgi:cystathionine beta-lyase/cystathionine gamma-synthase